MERSAIRSEPPPVGWDRGADRASNDADVSSIPPIIPYSRFSRVRLEGWLIRRGLPNTSVGLSLLPACANRRPFAFALRAPRGHIVIPVLSRVVGSLVRRLGGWVVLRPRGPRSGSSYVVSSHLHLVDPMRPTRRHSTTSSHGDLYVLPSLCGSA